MKTIPLRLTEEQYDVLRTLAFEQHTSMAELLRRAIEVTYKPNLSAIRETRARYLTARRDEEAQLRDSTKDEIDQFLAEDAIDEETAQVVRRLLAEGKL